MTTNPNQPRRPGRVSQRVPQNRVPSPAQLKTSAQPTRRIDINLNRKLMTHGIVDQLRDTAKSKEMVAGSAIAELLDEYDRMRYIMEGMLTAYERNDEEKVRKLFDVLKILL